MPVLKRLSGFYNLNTKRKLHTVQFWFSEPKPTDRWNATLFSGIHSLLFVYFIFKCDLSLFHMSFTTVVCLFFALLPHFIDFSFFFCFLFHVLCWLTGPCVACLLSYPSLNIARQSADPWASKSTKVKLTYLPTIMWHPNPPRTLLHLTKTACHIAHLHPQTI